jgi:tryptophan-rich sensory protein
MAGIFQNKIFQIVIAVLIPFLGMLINWVSGAQSNMYPWYDEIALPSWNPPGWVSNF